MDKEKAPSSIVVGLALFSMFFGAGNLIFPLLLGAKYQNYFFISCLGFILTAVLMPTLGILAMIPAHGRYEKLFEGLTSVKTARWFFLVLLLFWIPFGSGPRCVVLAHASLMSHLSFNIPLWLFSFLFLSLVYICVQKRSHLIDILGKILTPFLLVSIFMIVISSFFQGDINYSVHNTVDVLLNSIIDGYYTQDLIAAIFFSSAIVAMVQRSVHSQKIALSITLKAGLIAVFLLSILYAALMAASAVHGEALAGLSGENLVSALAQISLGRHFSAISSIAVSLACFTTEVALVLVFADFLSHNLFHERHSNKASLLTLVTIWALSLIKFQGIMAIISPAMQVIYPILFALVLRLLIRSLIRTSKN